MISPLQRAYLEKLYNISYSTGKIRFSRQIASRLNDEKLKIIDDEIDLLDNGYKVDQGFYYPKYIPEKNVFYLVQTCIQYNTSGYASRTHGLLNNINKHSNFYVRGITRPGYPNSDRIYISKELPKHIPMIVKNENVLYFMSNINKDKNKIPTSQYIKYFSDEVIKKCLDFKTSIVHAASNYPNGLTAIRSAKKLGIKSIYEIRGLWEFTRCTLNPYWKDTDQFKLSEKLETQALNDCDFPITITNSLKKIMIERGVKKEIYVLPNCVDISKFDPCEKDKDICEKYGIKNDEVVIGYAGSVLNYEGIDDVFLACRNLKNTNLKFKILIVGDGVQLPRIKSLSHSFKLDVIYTGRIEHVDVKRHISVMDIMPFARKPFFVCEIVSPLKPFEAMAMKKSILVSSVGALQEIVEDGKTGLIFEKGNINDLTSKLRQLISNSNLRNQLAENARSWVCQNRDWKNSAKALGDIYEELHKQTIFERNSLNK